ncbi:hypothetical protein [Bacillus thuringiensis]|uniref:hypothetical protein n=1 Tax=Bacillus thuringiensis TaxID=1428 RepID=UPI00211DA191|nr:hypothetical protein [Bacillus thuringiensis]
MNTPGVVIKSQFVYSRNDFSKNQDKEFGDYIDYIGRKDAVEKEMNLVLIRIIWGTRKKRLHFLQKRKT